MRRSRSWWGYVVAAFSARPWGMPVPPNWLFLAGVGIAAGFHPGLGLIGLGCELAYLLWLSTNTRFRAVVDAEDGIGAGGDWTARRAALLADLPAEERARQVAIEQRCSELAAHLRRLDADRSGSQADGLAQLCWLHLRLLAASHALGQVVLGMDERDLARRRQELDKALADAQLDAQVRSSLEGQRQVLDQRLAAQREALVRLRYVESELERLRQQVELGREQALLATDAAAIGKTITVLSASMDEASRWLREQREVLGAIDASEAPPAAAFVATPAQAPLRAKASQ